MESNMPEPKDWKDQALKVLIAVLLLFLSVTATAIYSIGSDTAIDVKEMKVDLKKLNKRFDRNSWIDSLQQLDIQVLKGKHE